MKKPNFLNKIATFYPTNSKNGNGSPIFYINYDNAPLTIELYLNCVLAGLTPEKSYIVHLNILSDDGTTKVDTDNYITGQDMFEGNYIKEENINTGSFTITTPKFIVNPGIHYYDVSLILKDSDGNIWDNGSTWFLTRPDQEKE